MKKTAIIILAEGFEEIEAFTPIDVLKRCGINVVIAGLDSDEIKSARGICVKTDCLINSISNDFDALILPGGGGASLLAKSQVVKDLILSHHEKEGIIAAICASPALVLSPLGVLKGKKATCYPACESDMDSNCVYITNSVVVDGNIITSRGPATAFEFSLTLAKILIDEKTAGKIGKAMLYYE